MVKEEKLLLAVKQSNFSAIEKILQINKNGKINRNNSTVSKQRKINLEIADHNGMNSLHHASMQGHANIVEALIIAGAHVDSLDKIGQRPLHFASAKGHLHVVTTLLRFNSQVNGASCDGTTPLHLASAFKHYSVAECLLKNHANVMARNQRGECPLDIAYTNNDYKMVTLLTSQPTIKQQDRLSSGYATPQVTRLSMIPHRTDTNNVFDRSKISSTTSDPTDSQIRRHLMSTSSNSSSSSCLSNSMNSSTNGGANESKASPLNDGNGSPPSSNSGPQQIAQLRPTHSQQYCQPNLLRKSISLNAKKSDESSGVTSSNSSTNDSLDGSLGLQNDYKRAMSLSPGPPGPVLIHSHAPAVSRKKQSPMFVSVDGKHLSLQSQHVEVSSELRQNLKEACFAVQARAMRDYKDGNNPQSISFREGDLITVLRSDPDSMWKGFVTAQGVAHTGYFPSDAVSFCTLPRNSAPRQRSVTPSQGRHPTSTIPSDYNLPAGVTPLQPLLPYTPGNSRSRNGSYNLSCNTDLSNHSTGMKSNHSSPNAPITALHPQMEIPACSTQQNVPMPPHLSSVGSSSLSPNSQGSCGVPLSPCSSWSQSNYTTSGSSNGVAQIEGCSNRNSVGSMDSGRGSFSTGCALPLAGGDYRSSHNGYHSAGYYLPSPPAYSSAKGGQDLMSQSLTLNSWQPLYQAHLHDWLCTIGMQKYFESLIQCGYDLPTLKRCNHEDLIACGVSHPNDRKILKFELERLCVEDNLPNRLPDSVNQWLHSLTLEQYATVFADNGYSDIHLVAQLTWDDLDTMGIQKLGHQKKFCLAIKKLNQLISKTSKQQGASSQNQVSGPMSNNLMTRSCDHLHALSPFAATGSPPIEIEHESPANNENLPYHHSLGRGAHQTVSRDLKVNPTHRLSEVSCPVPPKRTTSIQALSSSSSSSSSRQRQDTNSPDFSFGNDVFSEASNNSFALRRMSPSPIQSSSRSASNNSSSHSESRRDSGEMLERSGTRSSSRGDNSGIPFANEEIGTIRCGRMSSSTHPDLEEEPENYQDENDSIHHEALESNPELDKDMENICEMLDVLSEELEKEISTHQKEILA